MLARAALLALALLAAGCASTPKTAPPANDLTARVVDYALSLEGAPYHWGKASPEEGFDCSGFVWHVYRRHGLPIPRTTEQMARALPAVAPAERRPGDLLFFHTGDKPYSHVALYLGHEEFIHAPSSKTGRVMVSGLGQAYWRQRLTGVRRPAQ
jgi:cell wall-associated NlpC family hydrolase